MAVRTVLVAVAVTAAALPAWSLGLTGGEGETVEVEGLVISGAAARSAGPTAQSGAGYFTIENTTDRDDRLVDASSDAAQRVELHTHEVDSAGVARMVALDGGIDVPAGETVVLEQGGMHVMFMGLQDPWGAEGGVVVTLLFEQAGEVPVTMALDRVGHDHDPHAHDADSEDAGHGH